jgi:hypothetical protein
MSGGLGTRPTATTIDVEQLAKWAWEGRIRIPHFQRPLRWQRDDVIKLFDSILRGYPVGSLLLWKRHADAETVQLGALSIAAPELPDALLVVDGQQRITALANALHPDGQADERFRISYDLRKKTFVPTPRDISRGDVIPLPVIFDLREVLRWFADHPELIDQVNAVNEVTQVIRQFAIPAYEVEQEDPEVLEDIFDRLNSYGKRLTRSEIFSALNAGKEQDANRPTFDRIAQDISDDLNFGLIDTNTVMQALLARRAADVQRQIRIEFDEAARASDFPDEDRDTAYRQAEEALRRAVHFLQTVAGVPHFTLLPYKYLLVVLTRLFAHYPELDERSTDLVRRWFWRTALAGPQIFPGNTTGAARNLNRVIRPGEPGATASIQRLLDLIPESAARIPDLRRFRSNDASTKIVLCSWWSLGPRSLETGRPFEIADLAACIAEGRTPVDAVRNVYYPTYVSRDLRSWSANRLLYPLAGDDEADPGEIVVGSIQPLLNQEEREAALASHSIPRRVPAADPVGGFLALRQVMLEQQLDTFLRQRCEWGFEDTPPLDSLVLDDEDEAEELTDDESAGLR